MLTAEQIRGWCKAHEVSYTDLSRVAGVSNSLISKIGLGVLPITLNASSSIEAGMKAFEEGRAKRSSKRRARRGQRTTTYVKPTKELYTSNLISALNVYKQLTGDERALFQLATTR